MKQTKYAYCTRVPATQYMIDVQTFKNFRMTAMHSGVWSELYMKCDCRVCYRTVFV